MAFEHLLVLCRLATCCPAGDERRVGQCLAAQVGVSPPPAFKGVIALRAFGHSSLRSMSRPLSVSVDRPAGSRHIGRVSRVGGITQLAWRPGAAVAGVEAFAEALPGPLRMILAYPTRVVANGAFRRHGPFLRWPSAPRDSASVEGDSDTADSWSGGGGAISAGARYRPHRLSAGAVFVFLSAPCQTAHWLSFRRGPAIRLPPRLQIAVECPPAARWHPGV